MTISSPHSYLIFFVSAFVLSANAFGYDKDDCNKTVVCSDGTKVITTSCADSYHIINGHRQDTDDGTGDQDSREKDHGHHHGDGPDDPCIGHGQQENDDTFDPYGKKYHHDNATSDPYGIYGHYHDKVTDNSVNAQQSADNEEVSDDPYGLRKKLHHDPASW